MDELVEANTLISFFVKMLYFLKKLMNCDEIVTCKKKMVS